jgi:ATP-binding cassette subfamily F protein uup
MDPRPSALTTAGAATALTSKKLSYKEQRELDALPREIEALDSEEQALNARIAGPEFYKEGQEAINAALARLEAVARQLGDAYVRWHELESRSS